MTEIIRPIGWVVDRKTGRLKPVMPVMGASDWPLQGDGHRFESGVDTSLSAGFLVTAPGTIHTKGAWSQLIASTAFPAEGIMVSLGRQAQSAKWSLDIGIGAAASEIVIIPDVIVQTSVNDNLQRCFFFPFHIPQGTRASARGQADFASASCRAGITLIGYGAIPSRALGRVKAYGFDAATTSGVNIDPGGTIHTKGAYSQIVASTDHPIRKLIMALGYKKQTASVAPGVQWLIDIAIGAGGSEVVLLPDLWATVMGTMDEFAQGVFGPYDVNIPQGTRLAVRAQCTTATSGERQFEAVLYGAD